MAGFLFRRLLALIATFLVVTAALYGMALLTPPEERATLYMPVTNRMMTDEQEQRLIDNIIERYHLDQPGIVQYGYWLWGLLNGNWGYSPVAKDYVFEALIKRTPATAELTLYSLLAFIPLGVISGVVAGSRQGSASDWRIRLTAFFGASIPPFVLALVMLSIFYVGLHWFPIGRLGIREGFITMSPDFHWYTGLLTIDGLLNGKPEISLDALRHLALPVLTLSLAHWATLTRLSRAVTIEELNKEYILAARGRGIPPRAILWRHTLKNILVPALNSSALSVAMLVTGLYIVEVIFLYNGVSQLFANSIAGVADIAAATGFAVYSVLVVLALMTILDILQALIDPRLRQAGEWV